MHISILNLNNECITLFSPWVLVSLNCFSNRSETFFFSLNVEDCWMWRKNSFCSNSVANFFLRISSSHCRKRGLPALWKQWFENWVFKQFLNEWYKLFFLVLGSSYYIFWMHALKWSKNPAQVSIRNLKLKHIFWWLMINYPFSEPLLSAFTEKKNPLDIEHTILRNAIVIGSDTNSYTILLMFNTTVLPRVSYSSMVTEIAMPICRHKFALSEISQASKQGHFPVAFSCYLSLPLHYVSVSNFRFIGNIWVFYLLIE